MEDLLITYTVGACIFGLASLVTAGTFVYFVWQGRISPNNSKDHVHWLSSIWCYMLMCTTFLLLATLYALNAVNYGFYVKMNLHAVNLLRWLVIAVVGSLYQGCLAYILTNDHRTTYARMKKKKSAIGAQNFFILFFYFLSQVAIFFATITENHDGHIICMVASIVTFIISMVLYFFPDNKIGLDADGPNSIITYNKDVRDIENKITMFYRFAFLLLLNLSYLLSFIIWFLSYSNDMSGAVSYLGEAITYLVSDILFFGLFAVLFVSMTLYHRVQTRAFSTVEGGKKSVTLQADGSSVYLEDKNL